MHEKVTVESVVLLCFLHLEDKKKGLVHSLKIPLRYSNKVSFFLLATFVSENTKEALKETTCHFSFEQPGVDLLIYNSENDFFGTHSHGE